jgi:hypothetical protein
LLDELIEGLGLWCLDERALVGEEDWKGRMGQHEPSAVASALAGRSGGLAHHFDRNLE